MSPTTSFKAASPFDGDLLSLPVADIDAAAAWYSTKFGMQEVERHAHANPTVILEREGVRIGFSENGGDPSQHGAALEVANIRAMREEIEGKGVETGNWRIDERDGRRLQVFFVVAPDGLCYYFFEPLPAGSDANSPS